MPSQSDHSTHRALTPTEWVGGVCCFVFVLTVAAWFLASTVLVLFGAL